MPFSSHLTRYKSNHAFSGVLLFVLSFATTIRPAISSWITMMSSSRSCDVIVVGGGSAGLTAAKFAGNTLKKHVVLIEADRLGGDCTWTGCVPSKSFISVANSMYSPKQTGLIDVNTKADLSSIREKVRANIQQIYDEDDSPEVLQKLGIEVINGKASFLSNNTMEIKSTDDTTVELTAKEGIILCTGASAKVPKNIKGLCNNYLTYENVWDLNTLPNRLTVIGGGPIGCELAQAFARLGSKVTIVASTLLPREEDSNVSNVIENVFISEGIQIVKSRVIEIEQSSNLLEKIIITESGESITCDEVLVATGRIPRITDMNFDKIGIHLTSDKTAIAVDDKLQTSIKGIYAAGDCTGDRQFTHYAGYQGAIAARNILLPLSDTGVLQSVPATTFTSPQVASIGLTEKRAKIEYGNNEIIIYEKNLSNVDRAICDGQMNGFIKIICTKNKNKILGATIVAPVAGEMISEIAVIMKAGMTFDQLATVMHPYPTYSMALQLMAADVYYENTLKLKWLYDILKKLGL